MDERIGPVQETAAELRAAVFSSGKPGIKNELLICAMWGILATAGAVVIDLAVRFLGLGGK